LGTTNGPELYVKAPPLFVNVPLDGVAAELEITTTMKPRLTAAINAPKTFVFVAAEWLFRRCSFDIIYSPPKA
jgi:hypothetical protein